MSKDLRYFLQTVKAAGKEYYVEVKKPLKPKFEKDVLQLKLDKSGSFPVIYCHKIEGSEIPLVSNFFGSYDLMGMALDMKPKANKEDIFHEFRRRMEKPIPEKTVPASKAPVKEVILRGKDVDLGLLPINHHNELNSTKYVTIGNTVCRNPNTGVINVGVYRHELKGKDKLGVWTAPANHGAYHARRYAELGKPMQIAIFIGHHPAAVLGALSAGPMDNNEFTVMGGLLGEPIEVTPTETADLFVPAYAEIVLEGVIDPKNMTTDGPFSEWPGYYGVPGKCYVMDVKCMTMRHDAIYHDLAPAQREHCISGVLGFTSRVYDAVKAVVPTVKDVYLPFSGRHDMIAYVSIAQRVPGEAKRAGLAAVNADACIRLAVVVDEDIDVFDEEQVIWAIATRCVADIDIDVITRLMGGTLNPTSYDESRQKRGPMNSKIVINATKPIELPFPTRVSPPKNLWKSMKLEDYIE
ncbi:MAG: UbiD family decarboxylase [Dehalococcoidia bacterium]|nr:UbiD family decarboxylase [Dehalococcoidia bacterium]